MKRNDERKVGTISVEGFSWHWIALDAGAVPLTAVVKVVEIATRDTGIATDNILDTNDLDLRFKGKTLA